MPGKWDWLKDELKGIKAIRNLPLILKFIGGKIKGPDDLVKCALCPNMCRHVCPVSIVDGRETTSPAGKARIAFFIREGIIELNEENLRPLYMCLSCDLCSQYCPFGFSVSDLIRTVKEDAIVKGITFKEFSEVFENLEKYSNVYGESHNIVESTQEGDVLYIRGCTIRKYYPETSEKVIVLIKSLGFRPFIIDEDCCGIPAYNLGNTELFKKIAKKQAEKINATNSKLVVTSCPSCAYAYRVLYPKYGIKIEAKILHITEFIEENIKKLPSLRLKEIITIHDPCKLAVGLDKPEIIKRILEKIEGIEIRLPRRYGKETFCCGHGGSAISRINPSLSTEITLERIKELKEEAALIVTACPTCRKAFEDLGESVTDITEIILRAMEG